MESLDLPSIHLDFLDEATMVVLIGIGHVKLPPLALSVPVHKEYNV